MRDDDALRAAVIGVLCEVAPDLDPTAIGDDDDLQTVHGLDSMDMLDLAAGLQETLGADVPDADRAVLTTVGTIVAYLSRSAGSPGT